MLSLTSIPAVLIPRVSTKGQEEGHSIDAQRGRLEAYCERKGMPILRIFEIIESSTKGDRRQFHEVIAFVRSQKGKCAIVAETVDRMQRSFKESILLDELRRSGSVEIHFPSEGLILNEETAPDQILMWDFAVLRAKSYVTSLSHNVRRSLSYKLDHGEWIRKAPIGYRNVKDPLTKKPTVEVDPDRATLVRSVFDRYATGAFSLSSLSLAVKKEGLTSNWPPFRPLSRNALYHLLQNPFYAGDMLVKGKGYAHKYPALVSRDLFRRCQAIRERFEKQPFKYRAKPFLFRGLIRCAYCGCTITIEKKKNRYVYLCCIKRRGPCPGVRVREESMLEQIGALLGQLTLPKDEVTPLKDQLARENGSTADRVTQARFELKKEIAILERQLSRLLDLELRAGLAEGDYAVKEKDLRERLSERKERLRNFGNAEATATTFQVTMEYLIDLLAELPTLFESSNVDQKRQLLGFVCQNYLLDGETLVYQARKPFDVIVRNDDRTHWRALLDVVRKEHFGVVLQLREELEVLRSNLQAGSVGSVDRGAPAVTSSPKLRPGTTCGSFEGTIAAPMVSP